MTIRKRFIASSLCPKCNTLDTLVLWREDRIGVEIVKCIKCNFYQHQKDPKISPDINVDKNIIGMFNVF